MTEPKGPSADMVAPNFPRGVAGSRPVGRLAHRRAGAEWQPLKYRLLPTGPAPTCGGGEGFYITGTFTPPRNSILEPSHAHQAPGQVVALYPPSTTTTSPVTNRFDVTRETIVAATSAAVTQRPSGVIRARRCMSRS
jgi:hypothetical protein